MTHLPSDLKDAFPADTALLHALKTDNAHVRKLVEQYHALNHGVHRIESEVEPGSDEHLEALKKQRLGVLDALAAQLAMARTD